VISRVAMRGASSGSQTSMYDRYCRSFGKNWGLSRLITQPPKTRNPATRTLPASDA
jgi:hypothetical protein